MRVLLDTCAALWWWSGDARLPHGVAAFLGDSDNDVRFHQASYLEITIKYGLGKLPLNGLPSVLIPKALDAYRVGYSALGNRDIARLETLPWHHRDPFDRLLIAHALENQLTVVTADRTFAGYGVPVFW